MLSLQHLQEGQGGRGGCAGGFLGMEEQTHTNMYDELPSYLGSSVAHMCMHNIMLVVVPSLNQLFSSSTASIDFLHMP